MRRVKAERVLCSVVLQDAAKWCTKALEPLWGQDGRVRERRPAAAAELSF